MMDPRRAYPNTTFPDETPSEQQARAERAAAESRRRKAAAAAQSQAQRSQFEAKAKAAYAERDRIDAEQRRIKQDLEHEAGERELERRLAAHDAKVASIRTKYPQMYAASSSTGEYDRERRAIIAEYEKGAPDRYARNAEAVRKASTAPVRPRQPRVDAEPDPEPGPAEAATAEDGGVDDEHDDDQA